MRTQSSGLLLEIDDPDFTSLDLSAGCDKPFLKFDLEYNEMLVLETAAARRATSQVSRPPAFLSFFPCFSLSFVFFGPMFRTLVSQL
jgi:hypothetical protein